MADQPWFKFYAADYLLDPDVDAIPREAEALLVRMWCVAHREGSCPVDVETLARKTQCSQQYVAQFKLQCEPFFELRDGRLYSRRMEEEKRRSQQASTNANTRYHKQVAVQPAVPLAVPSAAPRSDSESDSDSGFNPPPLNKSCFALEENAREAIEMPKYTQTDFDARDRRLLAQARREVQLKLNSGWGRDLSPDEIFEYQCGLAGFDLARGLEVEKSYKATGASA
jgi:uncharacterized protein YdaU (DUF1376 family)